MKITIAIPSCSSDRLPLLIQTVESIQAGSYKNVHPVIVADGNPYIRKIVNKKLHNISVISNKERMDWIFSVNRVFREWDSDYYIFASDDLIFPRDCIKDAVETMREYFPDGYGVVAIGKKGWTSFGLFGIKWAEHFPNRQVFCPDYIHFCSDKELLDTTQRLNKYACPVNRENQVEHFRLKDKTRKLARKVRKRDNLIRDERKEKGYLWGINFNLITMK